MEIRVPRESHRIFFVLIHTTLGDKGHLNPSFKFTEERRMNIYKFELVMVSVENIESKVCFMRPRRK